MCARYFVIIAQTRENGVITATVGGRAKRCVTVFRFTPIFSSTCVCRWLASPNGLRLRWVRKSRRRGLAIRPLLGACRRQPYRRPLQQRKDGCGKPQGNYTNNSCLPASCVTGLIEIGFLRLSECWTFVFIAPRAHYARGATTRQFRVPPGGRLARQNFRR